MADMALWNACNMRGHDYPSDAVQLIVVSGCFYPDVPDNLSGYPPDFIKTFTTGITPLLFQLCRNLVFLYPVTGTFTARIIINPGHLIPGALSNIQ
jgi:hypothetical protein